MICLRGACSKQRRQNLKHAYPARSMGVGESEIELEREREKSHHFRGAPPVDHVGEGAVVESKAILNIVLLSPMTAHKRHGAIRTFSPECRSVQLRSVRAEKHHIPSAPQIECGQRHPNSKIHDLWIFWTVIEHYFFGTYFDI